MKDHLNKQFAKCTLISLLKRLTIPPMEGLKYANILITNNFVGSSLRYCQSSWCPVSFQNNLFELFKEQREYEPPTDSQWTQRSKRHLFELPHTTCKAESINWEGSNKPMLSCPWAVCKQPWGRSTHRTTGGDRGYLRGCFGLMWETCKRGNCFYSSLLLCLCCVWHG